MTLVTPGLHHVTSIAGDPQANLDFYTNVLGLRLVKQTVNFDDPHTYHLYYGNTTGEPGTILTFFPFGPAPPGRPGRGQVTATAFAIPPDAASYWIDRLETHDITIQNQPTRHGETAIRFHDHDGHPLELIPTTNDTDPWHTGPVPPEHAIRGFHGVTICSNHPDATASALETLGYEHAQTTDAHTRYRAPGERATIIDFAYPTDTPSGRQGPGTVHHIAFRTTDTDTQARWRERLIDHGYEVTPPRDRQYFTSIYFREPGGVLFEIATDGPGFTRDESPEELGTTLRLPPWLSEERDRIEHHLPPIQPSSPSAGD